MGNRTTKSFSSLRPQVLQDLVHTTAFTADEIKDLNRQFLHDCGHGKHKLSLEDFTKMYVDLFPEADGKKFIEQVFRTYDKEGTGKINFRQFLTTLSVQLKGDSLQKLEWAFNLYDTHGNNYITWDECVEIVTGIHGIGEDLVPNYTLNPEDLADHVFKKVNKGRNDTLDRRDFIEGASSSKTIQKLLQITTRAASEPFIVRKLSTGSYGKPRRPSMPKIFEAEVGRARARSHSAGLLEVQLGRNLPDEERRKSCVSISPEERARYIQLSKRRYSVPVGNVLTEAAFPSSSDGSNAMLG